MRIGLHTGEFVQEMEDFFGKNVIWASHIADHAQRGETLVSSLPKELTESAGDFRLSEGQEVELKGLAGLNRGSLPTIVFPAQAGIQRSVGWIPACAGMTDRVSSHLRDTKPKPKWDLHGWRLCEFSLM